MNAEHQNAATPAQIIDLIRQRKTQKVLGNIEEPFVIGASDAKRNNDLVLESIESAGWAPFHYDRGVDGIAQPWRCHALWHEDCRTIAKNLPRWFDDVKPSNKLPAMLSACGALVLVTWLPQFRHTPDDTIVEATPEKQVMIDDEHLAATSAMVQNLLLILTSHGMGTYWSSGGQFRTPEMFRRLGIDLDQRLLAAVFIEYPETMQQPVQRVDGKQRQRRAAANRWIREATLDNQ